MVSDGTDEDVDIDDDVEDRQDEDDELDIDTFNKTLSLVEPALSIDEVGKEAVALLLAPFRVVTPTLVGRTSDIDPALLTSLLLLLLALPLFFLETPPLVFFVWDFGAGEAGMGCGNETTVEESSSSRKS